MYKQISNFSKSYLILTLLLVLSACTDLDETINSEVVADEFFQSEEEFSSALGDAYGILAGSNGTFAGWGTHNGLVSINETSSDEMIITQKGTDWEDGGLWIRMKRHTFLPDDGNINRAWQLLFGGVNSTNRLIFQFESQKGNAPVSADEIDDFISELKVLRAFYYYLLLDNFGNVPIVTSFIEAPEEPSQPSSNFQEGRQAVFDFVESEILENIDALETDAASTYGRVNQWVAHMILAKLYLNAEVYTGTPRWADVVTQTDAIINSGNYSLATTYESNFTTSNEGSPEFIFAIPFDKVFLTGFNIHQMSLHYNMQSKFNMQEQPWNGYATMEEFYLSYVDPAENPGPQGTVTASDGSEMQGTLDDRLTNFFTGPQFDINGNRIEDPGATSADPDGPPLTLTPEIDQLEPNGLRQAGARVAKFEIEIGATSNLSNDFPIFRYTDVLLMKAEALWRQNNADINALNLVNMIRDRASVNPFTNLTAERLLAERGREMFYENVRRQDLIRFDGINGGATRYNDPWEFKDESEAFRNVFPIPRDQLQANGNLVQNPGY